MANTKINSKCPLCGQNILPNQRCMYFTMADTSNLDHFDYGKTMHGKLTIRRVGNVNLKGGVHEQCWDDITSGTYI